MIRPGPAETTLAPVLEAIGLVRAELGPERAVVGFCGGPFTVAGYLVEGRPSRDFALTKSLMYREPALWHALLEKLTDSFSAYALAQAQAGADVVQLFDSWAGALSPADYREFVAPATRGGCSRALRERRRAHDPLRNRRLDAPDCDGRRRRRGDRARLAAPARRGLGAPRRAAAAPCQGNALDPVVLLGPWKRVRRAALDVLARAGGRPGHIFNLGHGVLPGTDPDQLGRLVELVHAESPSPAGASPRRSRWPGRGSRRRLASVPGMSADAHRGRGAVGGVSRRRGVS